MIGVTARENGCTVVTGNTRHFSRIRGLRVENYREGVRSPSCTYFMR